MRSKLSPVLLYFLLKVRENILLITEDFKPKMITMSLSVLSKKVIVIDDKKKIADIQKDTIIEYLTDHVSAKNRELAELSGVTAYNIFISVAISQ